MTVVFITVFSIIPSAYCEDELTLTPDTNIIKPEEPVKKTDLLITASQNKTNNSLHSEANGYFNKKEYSKATVLLWSKIDKLDRSLLILLTKSHFFNKEYFEAIKAANLVLAKYEKDEEALTLIGMSHLRNKKERDAKDFFRKATEINPVYTPALEGLVEIYEKNSNYYELRLIYLDLISKLGEKSIYLNRLCEINTKDATNDQAVEYCNKAINLNDNIADNYTNLAIAYKNMNILDKAKSYFLKSAQRFPKSEYAQMNYAIFLEEQKNYIDSFKYYQNCNKANAFIERCWVGYTTTSYQLLKFSETLVGLKKSCNFNRKHSIIGRKAASQARNAKQPDWATKLEKMADLCGS